MERHWQPGDAAPVGGHGARHGGDRRHVRGELSGKDDIAQLVDIGQDRFGLSMAVLPPGNLPTPQPKPFFDLLDRALSDEIRAQVKRPFWIDTVGQSQHVEIRVKLDQAILRFVAPRGAGLRLELAHLPDLDGGHVGRPADRRDPVPAQPDPADPAARRGRRRLRQGPARAARFPAARGARGAPGGAGVPGDARAHRAPRRAAHDHAGRRQPRPEDGADALQAGACAARRYAGERSALDERRQRDAAHARGLSRLRQGRRRRGGRADQRRRAAGRGRRRRPSIWARRSSCACASPSTSSCCR